MITLFCSQWDLVFEFEKLFVIPKKMAKILKFFRMYPELKRLITLKKLPQIEKNGVFLW